MSAPAVTILATTSGLVLAGPVDAGNHVSVLAVFGIAAIVVGLTLVLVGRRPARRSGPEHSESGR